VGTPNTSSSGTCIPSFAKELPMSLLLMENAV
jgi:hypothetical protein